MTMRGWRGGDVEQRPYFLLSDLWESFKEWSAYGAGVPLVLNGNDTAIQYYVPYLSGIELYSYLSATPNASRQIGEDSDGDCYRDSSSDGSSDCELDRGMKYARDWVQNHLNTEDHVMVRDGFSSDDSDSENSQGHLLFQYLESDPPYSREPLADKIYDLMRSFPELRTSRSCDLLPSSWLSVAWYPIYRIPTGPSLKDLDACFLTFHSLSTPVADCSLWMRSCLFHLNFSSLNTQTADSAPIKNYFSQVLLVFLVFMEWMVFRRFLFVPSVWPPTSSRVPCGLLLVDARSNWPAPCCKRQTTGCDSLTSTTRIIASSHHADHFGDNLSNNRIELLKRTQEI